MPDNSFKQQITMPYSFQDATGRTIFDVVPDPSHSGEYLFTVYGNGFPGMQISSFGTAVHFFNQNGSGFDLAIDDDGVGNQAVFISGNKVLGQRQAGITSPTLTAPNANETALLNAVNAILAVLRASTGHGLIA